MEWLRWWHGTVTDPKFQWVARKSGQGLGNVLAVWAALLECASNATQCNADATRGNVASFDCNDFDVLLGLDDGCVQKIYDAMTQKNLIQNGRLSQWEVRQPKREDSGNPSTGALSSTERSRLRREKLKRDAMECNEVQRNATHGTDRLDKSREEYTKDKTSCPEPRCDSLPDEPKTQSVDEGFEKAWALYPKRPGASKANSLKAWKARIKAGVTSDDLIAGVQRYADYCQACGTEARFIKQPETFLGPGLHYLADWTIPAQRASPPIQNRQEALEQRNLEVAARLSGGAG